MTMRVWLVGAALLAVAAPRAGHAVTEGDFAVRTTGDLVALCDPEPGGAMAVAAVNFCQGFAQGAVTVEMEHDAASRSMKLFCLPNPRPTRDEALRAFVTWARATPGRMNEPATDGLFLFLRERFPCPATR